MTLPSRLVTVTGVLVITAGIGLAALRLLNTEAPARQDVEATVGSLALGLAVALPGILALMARHDRPVLLLPAAIALVPLSFLSFALVTLPLLIPAGLLVASYRRHRRPGQGWWDALVAGSLVAGIVAAVATLFVVESRRTYSTPSMVLDTEIISYPEVAMSLAFGAAVVALGWFGTAEPRPEPSSGPEASARHRAR